MAGPASPSLPRVVAACFGVAAFVAVLVWGLGIGLELEAALVRGAGGGVLMFLVGLILGRAMGDSMKRERPAAPVAEKNAEISKKGP